MTDNNVSFITRKSCGKSLGFQKKIFHRKILFSSNETWNLFYNILSRISYKVRLWRQLQSLLLFDVIVLFGGVATATIFT